MSPLREDTEARVSSSYLFASPRALNKNAGPMLSMTAIGKFSGSYAPVRAVQITFLPGGASLPKQERGRAAPLAPSQYPHS